LVTLPSKCLTEHLLSVGEGAPAGRECLPLQIKTKNEGLPA
jgi:hypothetical protein